MEKPIVRDIEVARDKVAEWRKNVPIDADTDFQFMKKLVSGNIGGILFGFSVGFSSILHGNEILGRHTDECFVIIGLITAVFFYTQYRRNRRIVRIFEYYTPQSLDEILELAKEDHNDVSD